MGGVATPHDFISTIFRKVIRGVSQAAAEIPQVVIMTAPTALYISRLLREAVIPPRMPGGDFRPAADALRDFSPLVEPL
jgi:hypothetical protein